MTNYTTQCHLEKKKSGSRQKIFKNQTDASKAKKLNSKVSVRIAHHKENMYVKNSFS